MERHFLKQGAWRNTLIQFIITKKITNESFNRAYHLKTHINSKHNLWMDYKCNSCEKSFPLEMYMKIHIYYVHNRQKVKELVPKKTCILSWGYKLQKRLILALILQIQFIEQFFQHLFSQWNNFKVFLIFRNDHDIVLVYLQSNIGI